MSFGFFLSSDVFQQICTSITAIPFTVLLNRNFLPHSTVPIPVCNLNLRQPLIYYLYLPTCRFKTLHISGIMQFVLSFLSFTIFLKFLYDATIIGCPFLSPAE